MYACLCLHYFRHTQPPTFASLPFFLPASIHFNFSSVHLSIRREDHFPHAAARDLSRYASVFVRLLMTFRSDSVCQRNMIFLARRISEPFTQNRWRQPWTPPIDEDSNADDDDGLAKGRETMELFVIVSDTSLPPSFPPSLTPCQRQSVLLCKRHWVERSAYWEDATM